MASDTDYSSDSNDLPETRLVPSLEACSKGLSELCDLLAGKTALLVYEQSLFSNYGHLKMLKKTIEILDEDKVILKSLMKAKVRLSGLEKRSDEEMPKKEDNKPQPRRTKLFDSPITSKPKTILSILTEIIKYSYFLKTRAEYHSNRQTKRYVGKFEILGKHTDSYIDTLENIRDTLKKVVERMEKAKSLSGI